LDGYEQCLRRLAVRAYTLTERSLLARGGDLLAGSRSRSPVAFTESPGPVSKRCINLAFHGIGEPIHELPPGEKDVWISRERFETILDQVQYRGDVRLSFDDGNSSDVRYALPALLERGLQATFFIVAGRLDAPGYLNERDVRRLFHAGMELGSHGMRHIPWRRLDHARLRDELLASRRILEDVVGEPVLDAACPFGAYDRRALKALHGYGYRRVFTSDDGFARPDRWLQPRNTVTAQNAADPFEYARVQDRPVSRMALRRLKGVVKRWR
jgi:peptidoglycan/xylan/chitin deacetylase (PgdA/CDA1 family)